MSALDDLLKLDLAIEPIPMEEMEYHQIVRYAAADLAELRETLKTVLLDREKVRAERDELRKALEMWELTDEEISELDSCVGATENEGYSVKEANIVIEKLRKAANNRDVSETHA